MKRRDFISNMMLAGGSLAFGGCSSEKKEFEIEQAKDGSIYITEPAKHISVLAQTDVLVVGGGPAGATTALAFQSSELPRHIDIVHLHQLLVSQKVWFGA
ncbi:MAG: hypothetical protein IJR07_07220 [Bacteroidaceae bacterium]|nr:hypothetical protein [Bacteroidaceae bacterium]